MKKLLSLFLMLLLLTGCAATYDGPTEQKPMLTEYTVQHYSNLFGNADILYTTRTVYAYDIYGNMVRSQAYRDGELEDVTNCRYDERGNLISETTWDHSGWIPHMVRREKRTYDEKNRLLTIVYRDGWGRETGRSIYTYDDENGIRTYQNETGEILQVTWYDENDRDLRQTAGEYETIYEYDDRGNQTGWVSYKNGALYDSYKARYDDQGRQIWGARYDDQGNLELEYTYVFDDKAQTMTFRRPDGDTRIEYYHADGRLHMIEDYNADGDLRILQRYNYQDIKVPAKEE